MLRHGASLSEIGLRHQHPNTTTIYAKVDFVIAPAGPSGQEVGDEETEKSAPQPFAMRRALGFKLCDAGVGLADSSPFQRQRASYINIELALRAT
jgi:hypothetical protein